MTKIVYNACYGGFGLSKEAMLRYAELKGIKLYHTKEYGFVDLYYTVPLEEVRAIKERSEAKRKKGGRQDYSEENAVHFCERDIERTDPILVQVVEELGDRANGNYAELAIAEVPAGTLYRIDEYDGIESVMTNSDYDWSVA